MTEATEADPTMVTVMMTEVAMVEAVAMVMTCLPETTVATTVIETVTTEEVQEGWILVDQWIEAATNQEKWVVEWAMVWEAEDQTDTSVVDFKTEGQDKMMALATDAVRKAILPEIALNFLATTEEEPETTRGPNRILEVKAEMGETLEGM